MTAEDREQYKLSLKHPDVEETIDLWFYRPVGFRVAMMGRSLGWTPNHITIVSILLGIGCGLLCYSPNVWVNLLAIVLLVLADIGDSADGQLARLTHQYSQLGRILDGAAGDFWFVSIYVCLALRLTPEWGVWAWLMAIAAGYCHSKQSAMADCYRQVHLLCVKGRNGSELEDADSVARQYEALRFSDDPVQKVFLWFYRNYTRGQETLTPWLQRLRCQRSDGELLPAWAVEQSRRLMPIANVLTFNWRAITLFVSLMLGLPWLYWVAELTVFNALCIYMVTKHEAFCRQVCCR